MRRTELTRMPAMSTHPQRARIALATCLAFIASPSVNAQAVVAPKTISHPLTIAKHPAASLTNADADSIIGSANGVLGQCRAVFGRQGNVASSTAMPSAIYSASDMAAACGASLMSEDPSPAGVPRRVRLVNNIYWCGSPTTTTIGCAYTPGTCLVVVRHYLDGILWSHEFGHSKGLPHRQDSDAVMHGTIDPNHRVFSSGECQSIRQLGLTRLDGPPLADASASRNPPPIEEFVAREFVHGVPYDEARLYTSSDATKIEPWLADANKVAIADNVATTIGIIADAHAFEVLRGALFAEGNGSLSKDQFNVRVAALMSLGYVVRGNGSADARSLLEARTDPSSWTDIGWMAPYHQNEAERNNELATLAVLGLALVGDEKALIFLRSIDLQKLGKESDSLARGVQQAITDIEEGLFEVRKNVD